MNNLDEIHRLRRHLDQCELVIQAASDVAKAAWYAPADGYEGTFGVPMKLLTILRSHLQTYEALTQKAMIAEMSASVPQPHKDP